MSETKKEEQTNNETKGTQPESSTASNTQPFEMNSPQNDLLGAGQVSATAAERTEEPKGGSTERETTASVQTQESEEVKNEGTTKQFVSFVVGLVIGALLVSILI